MTDVLQNEGGFTLIAGPCALESEDMVIETAGIIKRITEELNIDYYFKVSVDKANRTAATKFRGIGWEKGIDVLKKIKETYCIKIATDFHEPWQAKEISEVADIVQIPAYLARQTDMIKAAAETGKIINVKKPQFLSVDDLGTIVNKLEYYGCNKILVCDRGNCFGYGALVADMLNLVRMRDFGYPVVFDATHSVQIPGGGENYSTSGNSSYVQHLAKAAVAVGVKILFMEVHPNPETALCDAACMLKLSDLKALLVQLLGIARIVNERGTQMCSITKET